MGTGPKLQQQCFQHAVKILSPIQPLRQFCWWHTAPALDEMPQSAAETANVLGFSVVKGSEAKRMRMSESNPQTPFYGLRWIIGMHGA